MMKNIAIKSCLDYRQLAIARKTYVGASLYTDSEVYSGYNWENRCQKGYHAEEMAVIQAQLRHANPKAIKGIVVSFSKNDISSLTFACGHCRQVLWEYTFNPDLLVTEVDLEGNIIAEKTLGELYPYPYPLESFALKSTES
jgi:cytidine deaminase